MAARDPWSVLGVARGANAAEVRAAWRRRAAALHPDRNPQGHDAFIELQTAYRVLTDPALAEALALDPMAVMTGQLSLERRRAQQRRRRERVRRLYDR